MRILIVEDSDELARLMQMMLHHMNLDSDYVCTGHGALDYIAAQPPDLMILDLALPEMTGWQVLEQTENLLGSIPFPVIVLTAMKDPTNRLIGKLHHPDPVVRYLFKPFKINALSAAVSEVLNLEQNL
jgi:twitching motility two-component system response regulator PilG